LRRRLPDFARGGYSRTAFETLINNNDRWQMHPLYVLMQPTEFETLINNNDRWQGPWWCPADIRINRRRVDGQQHGRKAPHT
jgi:hypothetical protein